MLFRRTGSRFLTKDQGRLFAALSGFSAFKRTTVLMLATWNSQLATALPKDGFMVWGFYYVNSYKKGRLKGSSSRPAGSY